MQLDMSFIPDAVSGIWSVSTFEVEENDLPQMFRALKSGRSVPAGIYKSLKRNRSTIMSNTPDELRDVRHFIHVASGSVLINGLGLGCCVKMLLDKENVNEITVIEKSVDVINLVAPYFNDKRLTIINEDAFKYVPPKGKVYDFVWHDIWDNIRTDNLKEMTILHRKYGHRTNWQDSWARDICKRYQKQEKKSLSFRYL